MRGSEEVRFTTAFNSYRVVEKIGEGGSGTVYRVADEAGNPHAIKCLDPRKATSERRKRFQNEIFFCLRSQHANIIQVLDHGNVLVKGEQSPFYVMQYYPGTVRGLVNKGIPHEKILGYFSQVLDGVEAAHLRQIWHRDLKPENILYDPSADTLVVADFGVAHFTQEELLTLVETRPNDRLANF